MRGVVRDGEPHNLREAWESAAWLLTDPTSDLYVPGVRLNPQGTGLDLDRPANQHDLVHIRKWLFICMPRLVIRRGHNVAYDRRHESRRGA